MRKIKEIILHCSATPNGRHHDAADIRRWHMGPPRNWSDIGYHYVIRIDGILERGREENVTGAHAKGHNTGTIGICLIGTDEFSDLQWYQLRKLVGQLMTKYEGVKVIGHNEISSKTCPGFDVQEWLNKEFS